MKKTIIALFALIALFGCKQYTFNDAFTLATVLTAEEVVELEVTSAERVTFYWSGGSAADGGILLYDVLFDRAGGDFSQPLKVFQSDKGSQSRLTLTQSQMNSVAVAGGLRCRESGDFIWTVRASKGGVSRICDISKPLHITRGEGIDDIPVTLTVSGEGAQEGDSPMVKAEDGVFTAITRLRSGNLFFSSEGNRYYPNAKGVLVQGNESFEPAAVPESGLARFTVDFNTLGVTIDEIGTTVTAQWAANNMAFVTLKYKGEGVFSGKGVCTLLGPGRPGTPSWCSWTEQRYSYIAEVNGVTVRWGSRWPDPDGPNSANYPSEAADYQIYEVAKTEWGNLWKMYETFDQKTILITIALDESGRLSHKVEETEPDPEPVKKPLSLSGVGAEVQDQQFLQVDENVYRIYAKLAGGEITVSDGIDSHVYNVDATPSDADATRLTVNLETNAVTTEVVNKVRVLYAADFNDIVTLTYQGAGVWSGTGGAWYRAMGWGPDERYYFIPTINGEQRLCWGRKATTDPENRPDGNQAADYFDCNEFSWSQWEHCWKLPTAANNGASTTITLYTNKDGVMTHSVIVE